MDEFRDTAEIGVTLEDGTYIRMHFTDSGNEWDACVDYGVYPNIKACLNDADPDDGGQMDFNWGETEYEKIEDAIDDVIEFVLERTNYRICAIEEVAA